MVSKYGDIIFSDGTIQREQTWTFDNIDELLDYREQLYIHNSVLENYYARGLLDIKDRELNSKRFWAGDRFEKLCHRSGLEPKITARLEEFIGGTKEDFVHRNIDAHSEFHIIIKDIGKLWHILWDVIVANKPAKKRMDELREALDRLILYYDM